MTRPPHLVSAGRSHPCVPPLARGATRHVVVAGRCIQCGSTVDAEPVAAPRGRRGWLGERVLATAIGSGLLVLGTAYLVLATERMRDSGASLFSVPGIAGAACVALGGLLVMKGVRS